MKLFVKCNYLFILLLLCFSAEVHAQHRIEVMASHTIRAEYNNLENYNNIKECGFTLARENYPSRDIAIEHLKTAAKTNVKLIIGCPEILKDMENTVRLFNSFDSFGGYYICDEPGADRFDDLSKIVKRLKTLDERHYIWINVFPVYANKQQLKSESYEQYINDYIEIVKPPFLSFDCYGIKKNGIIPNYYQNLELISSQCKTKGIPFWAYVLTSQFGSNVYPTKGTLSFQAYSNLAYGAQAIEYFSYRRILGYGLNMTIAPVDTNYKKMAIYNVVKKLNSEIKYYSPIFYRNEIQDVSHLSKIIPLGTKKLKRLPGGLLIESYGGEGFVVSQFTNSGKKYVLFVNKDYQKSQSLTIVSTKKINRISCYASERQSIIGRKVLDVKAGSIVLLRVF